MAAPVAPVAYQEPPMPPPNAPSSLVTDTTNTAPPWQSGYATWYGKALAGHRTASGERFDPSQMTAAHKTLPLGTWVLVRRPENGLSVKVRINDRGPFGAADRIIDLSSAAADAIQMRRAGVVRVEVWIIPPPR